MTQDPRKLLDQATQLARSGQLDKAIALVVQLPLSPVKYQFQVDLLINRKRRGDLQQAEIICARWREHDPYCGEGP